MGGHVLYLHLIDQLIVLHEGTKVAKKVKFGDAINIELDGEILTIGYYLGKL